MKHILRMNRVLDTIEFFTGTRNYRKMRDAQRLYDRCVAEISSDEFVYPTYKSTTLLTGQNDDEVFEQDKVTLEQEFALAVQKFTNRFPDKTDIVSSFVKFDHLEVVTQMVMLDVEVEHFVYAYPLRTFEEVMQYHSETIYLSDSVALIKGEEYDMVKYDDHITLTKDNKTYIVTRESDQKFSCTCPSFKYRKRCKHIDAYKTELQREGKYRPTRRFFREEIEEVLQNLDEYVLRGIVYEVAGSFRRGLKDSKDLDIIVLGFEKDKVQERLRLRFPGGDEPRPGDRVAPAGGQSGQHILRWYVPIAESEILIDFLFTTEEHYEPTLLFFTGSYQFNIKMRVRAKDMGYALNQYGLWDREDRTNLIARSELEIFEALGMDYVPPHER